jgi:hypothetical protein
MLRDSQLGRAGTTPPVRDGPDGIANFVRDQQDPGIDGPEMAASKRRLIASVGGTSSGQLPLIIACCNHQLQT